MDIRKLPSAKVKTINNKVLVALILLEMAVNVEAYIIPTKTIDNSFGMQLRLPRILCERLKITLHSIKIDTVLSCL